MLKTTEPVFVMTQKELDAIQAGREGGEEFALRIALKAIQLYAESHPRPSQVTQDQAAEMVGVSAATISRMVKAGELKLNKFGRISIGEIDRALCSSGARGSRGQS